MQQNTSVIKITICIATCKRQQYLAVLLKEISVLLIPDDVQLQVVVVDNDPQKSAEPVIEGMKRGYRFPLVYAFEERRGIPFTRNKAVSLADADADFIAFIDDDEYPKPDWIQKLLDIQQQTGADLVQGPSLPVFVAEPPKWIVKGGFFLFTHHNAPTGSALTYLGVATNNMMVKYKTLMQVQGPFDERLALIGSEDTTLGIQLSQTGCKMVYTQEAIAYEHIPTSRTTLQWILQRAYRTSNMYWRLTMQKNLINLLKLITSAIARLFIGTIFLLPSVIAGPVLGWHYAVKMLQLLVKGVAIIAGILGKNYEEYRYAYTTAN